MCGNRSATDLINAADAGADLLGIIFADAWRRIPVEYAKEIVATLRGEANHVPTVVGVFVDQPVEEVNATADEVGLDMIQLHGTESPDYWEQMERPLIICRRISSALTPEQVEDELEIVAEFMQRTGSLSLIEPHVEGEPGGARVSLDFALAERLARRYSFILAGGLGPGNVGEAIRSVRPWGVDVSSGVETDRVKDPSKVGRFVYEARRASTDAVGTHAGGGTTR
ncbi:MAG: phosphoribosylanthranilate isomerase [Chloroflexi bacterium]|nr:phosphoribosylanthranilate isomerase [Chloroflexota bacterium]